ncbi:AbrB/MazE/SpoVT family DNA-binding domain-containing protein [Candidatus Gottesmanbacteria bacterium]|nr:AbrB/MazE/SpoVT family DNA-binding domain-containing protein [Candidatus Gottesmanbacteria bacterium]MBI5452074.1 AbrB/MazE/SpoVT family DNA-binding domain-containing protein [Candidatus Gottesmanbacteria bacterium]
MDGLSTITQKGQVVIPQSIRNLLQLKPATRVYFEVKYNAVVMHPVLSIDQALGMIKTRKRASQADYDKAIREGMAKRFKKTLI